MEKVGAYRVRMDGYLLTESTAAAAAGTRFESGVLRSNGATALDLNKLSLFAFVAEGIST